ncbi:transposase [Aeribacillus composti]|uniref:transposase n=1 Tax=Aeribacillus composti TaxID=1868734 RepID=UPI002E1BD1EF|nr:transposase [Aeribacillus composti]MED0746928.1 transposase [Aeribacillus composti]
MTKKQRRYEEDFKRQTVRYILEEAKSVAQVARELKINENTLRGWVKKYKKEPEISETQTLRSEDHEVRELKKRIRDLEDRGSQYASNDY